MRQTALIFFCFVALSLSCGQKPMEDKLAKNGVHTIATGYVSAFAVPIDNDQVVLVDTGGEEDGASVTQALADLGYATSDVSHVFITHGHLDHVLAVDVFPDALLVGFAEDEPLIEEKLGRPLLFDLAIDDGERMMIGEVMFEAFHLPGHTAGNATYLVNKVMIMGDTAMAQDDDEVGESPAFFSASPEAEREQISNLWRRLENRSADVEWLFFSHSGPLEGLAGLENYARRADGD